MNDAETNRPEVEIEKLVYGGQGLSRLDGRVVLTPFVLPGERVRIEIEQERRGLLEAGLDEVLTPSAGRIDPACPYFYRCGGCQYQHAAYETQLEAKRAILREALVRIGKVEAPEEIRTIAGQEWHYRNRTQLHLAGREIGYFGHGSHHLVPVERCPISSPRINEAVAALRQMLPDRRFPEFLRSLELFTNENEIALNAIESGRPLSRWFFEWCGERIPGFVPGALEYHVGETLYRVRRHSFFQVNRFLLEPMIEAALEGAAGETALDLYAGVGLFSLPLARRFRKVEAVESSSSAVGDLEFNAARAGVAVAARRQPVEAYLRGLEAAPDFVLADPPRTGLGKQAVGELLRLKPPRLTVAACDPATLARDLGALTAGGYRLDSLTLIDLFPQTFHIEAIARLAPA
jgi:23S rRNA (uracil1939-C5)-methyltransferase